MNFCSELLLTGQDQYTGAAVGGTGSGSGSGSGAAFGIVPLGTRAVTRDGRVFRFCRVGATALVAGSLYQASAPVPNHLAMTPSAAAISATVVSVTLGATLATINQYAGGWLQVDTTPGNGYMYGVSGHAAIGSGGVGNINLAQDDAIQVALTGSSRVGLIAHPYADVIVAATTVTNVAVGVATSVAAAGQYAWLQTWGPCAALINGTPGVGIGVVSSATTAGAFDVAAVAAEINVRILGRMMQVGVSGKNNAVFLTIAP